MAFKLKQIVPWGRSYEEYVKMFSLDSPQLKLKILSVADGPASFNCELTSKGGNITSIDPLYQFTARQIHCRINAAYAAVIEETRRNKDKFA